MKKQYLACWDTPNQWGREPTWRRKRKFYKKKSFNSKRERNIKENIITNQALKSKDFLEKQLIVRQGKTTISIGCVEKQDIMLMNAKI